MEKKVVSGTMLTLLVISMLTLAFNIQPVRASGTIYIRADGSIDPPDAPISTVDYVTYTFTGNITSDADGIVIERDNIVIDGADYTVTGSGSGNGTTLTDRSNVTLRNMTIKNFYSGIYLDSSSNNALSGNNVTANGWSGIVLISSSNNVLSGNNVTANNFYGIGLGYTSDNVLSGNNVANNRYGIWLGYSSDDVLSGNNVMANNDYGIRLSYSSNSTLSGNAMVGNQYNFGVDGSALSHYLHSVDVSNLVDGKPVYYFVNQSDMVVNAYAYPEVGYLGFVNCANVTVQGLNLTGNGQGLLLAFTNDSKITGNNLANNGGGIYLIYSSSNVLSSNKVTPNNDYGIRLDYSPDSTLYDNNVANNTVGIYLDYSSNSTLSGNNVTANNDQGIGLYSSSDSTLSGNNVANNGVGIDLGYTSDNVLSGNNVANNGGGGGIWLHTSFNNTFHHNNFINNAQNVYIWTPDYANSWDDGYPSGGNYWSDYTGVDANYDGIGDSSYVIDANNQDRYPLMGPFSTFVAGTWNEITYNVNVVSNSTVSGFTFNADQKLISFTVSGLDGTVGFCRATVPNDLLGGPYVILINDSPPLTLNEISNGTHTFLYFTYNHSTQSVDIIGTTIVPEFPMVMILPLFMVLTLFALMFRKKSKMRQTRFGG